MTGPQRPAVVETHQSVLFFYGNRVVKVRRPLAHGVVDLRTPDQRRASCEREVELNRPLAPDVYLGTATVAIAGAPVEHAVVMRRLPKDRALATVVRRELGAEAEVERVADVLARFHAEAARSARIDAAATGGALWQRWQAVEEALGRFVGSEVDTARYRELTSLARRYVEGRGPLFRRRIAEGAICDGHGNLEATDVFCVADSPRVLGRLVLDEEGRYADVLADVAALAQDIELTAAWDASTALLGAYERISGRRQPTSLVHFYVAQRAHVRLLTRCLAHEQGLRGGPPAATLVDQAIAHLGAALPRLVLVGGRPGTGRSALASWLGTRLDAAVLSDRRSQAGPGSHHPASPGGAGGRRTPIGRMCEKAGALLATGRSVVLEAAWSDPSDRRRADDMARQASVPLVAVRWRDRRSPAGGDGWPEWSEALEVNGLPTVPPNPPVHGPAAGPGVARGRTSHPRPDQPRRLASPS